MQLVYILAVSLFIHTFKVPYLHLDRPVNDQNSVGLELPTCLHLLSAPPFSNQSQYSALHLPLSSLRLGRRRKRISGAIFLLKGSLEDPRYIGTAVIVKR